MGVVDQKSQLPLSLFRNWQESLGLPAGQRQRLARDLGGETTIVLGVQHIAGHIQVQWH